MSHTKKQEKSYFRMNKEQTLRFLGLAMRAGQLTTGEESVLKDIRQKKAKLILLASDASANTKKKFIDKSSHYNISCYHVFTQSELSQAIGKPRVIISVNDPGFAKKLKELIKS